MISTHQLRRRGFYDFNTFRVVPPIRLIARVSIDLAYDTFAKRQNLGVHFTNQVFYSTWHWQLVLVWRVIMTQMPDAKKMFAITDIFPFLHNIDVQQHTVQNVALVTCFVFQDIRTLATIIPCQDVTNIGQDQDDNADQTDPGKQGGRHVIDFLRVLGEKIPCIAVPQTIPHRPESLRSFLTSLPKLW